MTRLCAPPGHHAEGPQQTRQPQLLSHCDRDDDEDDRGRCHTYKWHELAASVKTRQNECVCSCLKRQRLLSDVKCLLLTDEKYFQSWVMLRYLNIPELWSLAGHDEHGEILAQPLRQTEVPKDCWPQQPAQSPDCLWKLQHWIQMYNWHQLAMLKSYSTSPISWFLWTNN